MRNLRIVPVPPAYISYFVSIRDAKKERKTNDGSLVDHKAILIKSSSAIESRYREFQNAIDQRTLERLSRSPSMKEIEGSLRSCYNNAAKGVRALKTVIAEAQGVRVLKYCPLCGTTLVATHDHYLPASLFPEYAVHPLNLVPCCSECNATKGDDWLDKNGQRLYIHAYTDLIPTEVFLHVQLKTFGSARGVGAVFSVARPPYFSKAAWSVIASHVERLKLIERFTELSNDEIAEILADCRVYLQSGGVDVSAFLSNMAQERADIYGRNHWQVVLMGQLASSPRLSDWVAQVRD